VFAVNNRVVQKKIYFTGTFTSHQGEERAGFEADD
jgi:hypothetical protein